jgi:hypothetical protein
LKHNQTAVGYLWKWISSVENLQALSWATLRTMPHWEEIEKTMEILRKFTPSFGIDDVLFDEFACVLYVNPEKFG